VIQRVVRRALGLNAARTRVRHDALFSTMADGTRLHCLHFAPEPASAAATLLLRSPYGVASRSQSWLGQLLAESGYHVVLQDMRGRYASEGSFIPFENEVEDGAATLDWLAEQSWCDGRIGVVGVGYAGTSAWAALSKRAERVSALVGIFCARDLYRSFYRGGAFSLANSLEWGVGLGERESLRKRDLDLERGLRFAPTLEADRVVASQRDWLRDWLQHPRRDSYWDALEAPLPEELPPTLLVAGWYDPFLEPQLDDYARLRARGDDAQLVIGPWSHSRSAHRRWRSRANALIPRVLREVLQFLDAHLRRESPASPKDTRVRYFDLGSSRWRSCESWPPESEPQRLALAARASGGRMGQLLSELPGQVAAAGTSVHCTLRYDPNDPVPSCGGPRLGALGGAFEQGPVEERADVACYTGERLGRALPLAGPVRLRLWVRCDSPDIDVFAKLVVVDPSGGALNLCDGIQRLRWSGQPDEAQDPDWLEAGQSREITIDLGAIAHTFAAGQRVRLEVAAGCFPRFDRNPAARVDPPLAGPEDMRVARLELLHDADHESWLELAVLRD
jgi:putative CocE/NonD family hydrolase